MQIEFLVVYKWLDANKLALNISVELNKETGTILRLLCVSCDPRNSVLD
jgi:hypothetical protein